MHKHGKRYQKYAYKIKKFLNHIRQLSFMTPLMVEVCGAVL